MAMTYRRQSYELRPGTYFNYPREYGSTGYSGFGSPPAGMPDVTALIAQDINIAANTQYTFVFSSLWTTQSGLQAALNNDFTPDIATNVVVTTQGVVADNYHPGSHEHRTGVDLVGAFPGRGIDEPDLLLGWRSSIDRRGNISCANYWNGANICHIGAESSTRR